MIKTIKVQLLPNNKQNSLLFQSAGTARWAYNWALGKQIEHFENTGKLTKISDSTLRKELTQLKRTEDFKWLYNYSNNITKQAVKDLCGAIDKFHFESKKNGYQYRESAIKSGRKLTFRDFKFFPRFKSKHKSEPAFYHDTEKIKFTKTHVQLEKLGKIKLAENERIPINVKYSNPRITFDGLNWFLSVGIEQVESVSNQYSEPIGIDLGIKATAIISDNREFKNINKTKRVKKATKRLKRLQRRASKQYLKLKKGQEKSKNLIKLETRIRKTHKRLKDIRTNYTHQITAALVKTKPKFIVIEDLNVSGMLKNRHLSKAIQQQNFYEFRRQLTYKAQFNNIELIIAPRFFPSSKTCSHCGHVHKQLNLSDRVFKCPACSFEINRDLQAAQNLLAYGLSVVA